MNEHTPTPWKLKMVEGFPYIELAHLRGFHVEGRSFEEAKGNAELIIKATHSHQVMKEALEDALRAVKMIDGGKQDFDQQWLEQVHRNGIKALIVANGQEPSHE